MANPIRMAQYGTKHGHATGKLVAMLHHPRVELAGVYEPDLEWRRQLAQTEDPYREVHWFGHAEEMLGDATIQAIASEGLNIESLGQTEQVVTAGKHVWYDKPAGEDWPQWQRIVSLVQDRGLHIQMGYMFRQHAGFQQIADWSKSGLLGDLFGIRAHMSTCISEASRRVIRNHKGGVFYDLAGHMLDQIVWLLGRPRRVTSFLRNDSGLVPGFADNTLAVLEYDRAMAMVDIAAMETRPMARRFEVYGSQGSAILIEPFEPGAGIRLCLDGARGGYRQGEQFIEVGLQSRQALYERELDVFLAVITGQKPPDRSPDHELLVQHTLLRCTGAIPGD